MHISDWLKGLKVEEKKSRLAEFFFKTAVKNWGILLFVLRQYFTKSWSISSVGSKITREVDESDRSVTALECKGLTLHIFLMSIIIITCCVWNDLYCQCIALIFLFLFHFVLKNTAHQKIKIY